jgi:hypothetical protein
MAMGKWLERALRRVKAATQPTCKTPTKPSEGFAGSSRRRFQGELALSTAIDCAANWPVLSRICEEIDAAYRAEYIDLEAADELTVQVRRRARSVPERDEQETVHEEQLPKVRNRKQGHRNSPSGERSDTATGMP